MVELIDLYSKNSDGTTLTPDQQRTWVDKARSGACSTPPTVCRPHPVQRRIGADIRDAIIRRYCDGETAKALAEEFGIARNSVLNILRDHNVVVRNQPPSVEQRQLLVRDYEAGASIAKLVTTHGHSYGTIRRALKEAGVTMRPRGGNYRSYSQPTPSPSRSRS